MKQKLWCYLSVVLLILPLTWAVGDTFSIITGSVYAQGDVFATVFYEDNQLYVTDPVSSQNGFYALSITIPFGYSSVGIRLYLDQEEITRFNISSGQTIRADILDPDEEMIMGITQIDSFDFQPVFNQEIIQEISKGDIGHYEGEIQIRSLQEIRDSLPRPEQELRVEQPQIKLSSVQKINDFFLTPWVLLTLCLVCCVLIVILVLKGRRTTHL